MDKEGSMHDVPRQQLIDSNYKSSASAEVADRNVTWYVL